MVPTATSPSAHPAIVKIRRVDALIIIIILLPPADTTPFAARLLYALMAALLLLRKRAAKYTAIAPRVRHAARSPLRSRSFKFTPPRR